MKQHQASTEKKSAVHSVLSTGCLTQDQPFIDSTTTLLDLENESNALSHDIDMDSISESDVIKQQAAIMAEPSMLFEPSTPVFLSQDFPEYVETPPSSATSEHPDKFDQPQIFSPSSSYSCQKRLQDIFSLEDQTIMADPPSSTSQPQDTCLLITSGPSASDELDTPSQITCKISKGTLIFSCAKNQVHLGFDFESVTLVPGILKSKSKKGKEKYLQSPKKRQIIQVRISVYHADWVVLLTGTCQDQGAE